MNSSVTYNLRGPKPVRRSVHGLPLCNRTDSYPCTRALQQDSHQKRRFPRQHTSAKHSSPLWVTIKHSLHTFCRRLPASCTSCCLSAALCIERSSHPGRSADGRHRALRGQRRRQQPQRDAEQDAGPRHTGAHAHTPSPRTAHTKNLGCSTLTCPKEPQPCPP